MRDSSQAAKDNESTEDNQFHSLQDIDSSGSACSTQDFHMHHKKAVRSGDNLLGNLCSGELC
jgi:hypothetical protein